MDEKLPDTPIQTGFVSNNAIFETAINLIAYLNALKLYPIVYEGENDGRLIRHVVPRLGFEEQISSYGSSETFYPHVDNPDLSMAGETDLDTSPIPHTLTLLCLRHQKGVATSIVPLVDVLSDLSQEDIELLSLPHFKVKRPASFQSNNLIKSNLPILRKHNGSYLSRFDYHNVFSDFPDEQQALQRLQKASLNQDKWISLYLEPGQAVTFDNQKVLHTRNGFKPLFNGKDRWLLRVFGLYDDSWKNHLLSKDCNHHLHTK